MLKSPIANNLSTSDIHAAYEYVKELGAEHISQIQTYSDLSEFTFNDPDGNVLMICTCYS
ncbi:VOC family protein [Paenibacillus amylolyticus]|uniref:VOC family protein n=1 Tax=Paenibacillus amylolyticus TaxID=1451 RepID=UPI003D95EDCF